MDKFKNFLGIDVSKEFFDAVIIEGKIENGEGKLFSPAVRKSKF